MSAGVMEKPANAEQEQSAGELIPRPKVVPPVRTFKYRYGRNGFALGDPYAVLGHYLTYTIAGGFYVEEIVHTHARGVQLVTRLSLAPGTWYDIVEVLDEEIAH